MRLRDAIFALLATAAVGRAAEALTEQMFRAHMLGQMQAPSAWDTAELALQPQWTALPFDQAVDFFRRKTPMTSKEWSELEDRYKSKGFRIAGDYDLARLRRAHDLLGEVLADGIPERQAIRRLKAELPEEGEFHLRTAYDQAMLGSYAAGRWAQLTHPDVLRARPYWQYRTVGDNRVRLSHRAMDGKVYPADHAVWQEWYPPNGYSCRCGVRSISASEAEASGLAIEERLPDRAEVDGQAVIVRPDPGFSGSPATQETADRVLRAIERDVHGRGALLPTAAGLDRAGDPERRQAVDRLAGLGEDELEDRLRELFVFNVYPEADAEPPAGHLHVDWAMYSQDMRTVEQMAWRLVQERGLWDLRDRDRIEVKVRASYLASWDPERWRNPEVVFDDDLARRLGVPAGQTAARSTELVLRLRARPAEIQTLLGFLAGNGEDPVDGEGRRIYPGRSPVRGAWDVQDVRVTAGRGVDLPGDDEQWRRGTRNVRRGPGGGDEVTLSRQAMKGFDRAETILVNRRLWEYL